MLGAMGLGVRMKAAAGKKLLLVAHSSCEVCVLSSRNIAQLPVLAIRFWDTGRPDTGVASIAASNMHIFTAESSQVLIAKCSNGAEGGGGRRRVNGGGALYGDVIS
jgi:hypothetical protein